MCTSDEFLRRAKLVNDTMKEQLNKKSMKYNWHHADVTMLEGILARGDRKISAALLRAYELGCVFDAWDEFFNVEKWNRAFRDTGIDTTFYTTRTRQKDEIFPWDFIDCGVTKDFLYREYERSLEEQVTRNCRAGCSGCGVAKYKGGVCVENKN